MVTVPKLRVPFLVLILFILTTQLVAGQSLPACANTCVKTTKTKCKATDFKCACTPKKSAQYMERLTECINNNCGPGGILESYQYLSALCAVAGAPIDRKGGTATDRYELRRALGYPEPLEARQFDSAFPTPTPTPFAGTTTTTRSSTASRTSSANPTSTNTSSSSGLTTGAKIGIGLGVPLGVIVIGLLVGLGFWLGRRNNSKAKKEEPAPAYSAEPHMAHADGAAGLPELSQDAAYRGSELPTKSNTSEMAGSPVSSLQVAGAGGTKPAGYFPKQGQGEAYVQPYPSEASLGFAGGYPQEGYGQPYNAAELPERRDTVGRGQS